MQVVVLNGTLSEAEQDVYVQRVAGRYPPGAIEKIFLDVHEEYVDIRYTLHRYREFRKLGGYCIGEPESWNAAKRAELRDTIPNRIDL